MSKEVKDRLIGLHNHQIQFNLDGEVYIIPREAIEKKFNLYWFKGTLYDDIIRAVKNEADWLYRYKV